MSETLLRKRWNNCQALISQVKRGEWVPVYNKYAGECLTAVRGDNTLWIGNGSFFYDVNGSNAFGLILRHYAYMRTRAVRVEAKRIKKAHEVSRTPDLRV